MDIGRETRTVRNPECSRDSARPIVITQSADYRGQDIRVVDTSAAKFKVVFHQTDDRWVEIADAGWDQESSRLWFTSDQSGFQHLYVVNKDGGGLRQLTKGNWEVHNDTFSHSPQWIGHYIYYSSTQKSTAERQFYRISVDGGTGSEILSNRVGLNIGWISDDGQKHAVLEADPKNPIDLYVNGERVTVSPLPEFSKLPWAEARYLTYPSHKDLKSVVARLLLTRGYNPDDPNQPTRPAILYIHGPGCATSVLKVSV